MPNNTSLRMYYNLLLIFFNRINLWDIHLQSVAYQTLLCTINTSNKLLKSPWLCNSITVISHIYFNNHEIWFLQSILISGSFFLYQFWTVHTTEVHDKYPNTQNQRMLMDYPTWWKSTKWYNPNSLLIECTKQNTLYSVFVVEKH